MVGINNQRQRKNKQWGGHSTAARDTRMVAQNLKALHVKGALSIKIIHYKGGHWGMRRGLEEEEGDYRVDGHGQCMRSACMKISQ